MNDGKELIPCYIGRDKCGCAVTAIVDDPNNQNRKAFDKEVKKFLRDCINDGLTVDRQTVGWVRENFGHKCSKKDGQHPDQGELF